MAAAPPDTSPDPLAPLSGSLRRLAGRGEVRRYRKGHRLIEEGELGDTLFIILGGRVRVFGSGHHQGMRDREVTYGTYGAGEYIGEISLDGGPRSASVEAIEPCTCAVVTRQTLLQHIADHPEFALELLAKVSRRARAATLSTKQMALNDVYGRLVLLLNELAVPQPDGTRLIPTRPTHQEIANRLGCSREMVSRLLKDLLHGGFIRAQPPGWCIVGALPARW